MSVNESFISTKIEGRYLYLFSLIQKSKNSLFFLTYKSEIFLLVGGVFWPPHIFQGHLHLLLYISLIPILCFFICIKLINKNLS